MIHSILVPTDFSNNAYNALFHAVQLTKNKECTFHLLNVYDNHTPIKARSPNKELLQLLRQESDAGLQEVYHKIKLDEPNSQHIFETISKKGDLVSVIEKIIKEKSIDLVVMGNSGRSEIEAIFMGSNVLRTIGGIKNCPILTIPKEIDFKPSKKIAFVTDFKSKYDEKLLEPLRFIAEKFDSKINIMHINETEKLSKAQGINRDTLLEYFSNFRCSLNWMPLFKSKTTAIHDFLAKRNVDMLTMINNEHSFLEKISREPIIKRIAFDLDISFLVIPYQD